MGFDINSEIKVKLDYKDVGLLWGCLSNYINSYPEEKKNEEPRQRADRLLNYIVGRLYDVSDRTKPKLISNAADFLERMDFINDNKKIHYLSIETILENFQLSEPEETILVPIKPDVSEIDAIFRLVGESNGCLLYEYDTVIS